MTLRGWPAHVHRFGARAVLGDRHRRRRAQPDADAWLQQQHQRRDGDRQLRLRRRHEPHRLERQQELHDRQGVVDHDGLVPCRSPRLLRVTAHAVHGLGVGRGQPLPGCDRRPFEQHQCRDGQRRCHLRRRCQPHRLERRRDLHDRQGLVDHHGHVRRRSVHLQRLGVHAVLGRGCRRGRAQPEPLGRLQQQHERGYGRRQRQLRRRREPHRQLRQRDVHDRQGQLDHDRDLPRQRDLHRQRADAVLGSRDRRRRAQPEPDRRLHQQHQRRDCQCERHLRRRRQPLRQQRHQDLHDQPGRLDHVDHLPGERRLQRLTAHPVLRLGDGRRRAQHDAGSDVRQQRDGRHGHGEPQLRRRRQPHGQQRTRRTSRSRPRSGSSGSTRRST